MNPQILFALTCSISEILSLRLVLLSTEVNDILTEATETYNGVWIKLGKLSVLTERKLEMAKVWKYFWIINKNGW